jgi:hypothetical protein
MGIGRRSADSVGMCSRTSSDAGAHGVGPTERNMRFVVDRFAESLQTNATNPPAPAGLPLHYLAKSLARLLAKARREFDSNREAAKASLVTASSILQSEIERSSGANGSRPGAFGWLADSACARIYRREFT